MSDSQSIASSVANVRARIERACVRSARDPGTVTLIAVSKTHPVEAVRVAMDCGVRDFGENRVQEGAAKVAAAGEGATWHLIGHLQTNKVRAATAAFGILHGIDSERLARAVSEAATEPVRCFIEVNVAAEDTKFGVSTAAAVSLAVAVRTLPNLCLEGLMTVAPRTSDPEDVRPVFRELAGLARELELPHLSMGMTDDFEVAIEEGATFVRVGRAIFGERAR